MFLPEINLLSICLSKYTYITSEIWVLSKKRKEIPDGCNQTGLEDLFGGLSEDSKGRIKESQSYFILGLWVANDAFSVSEDLHFCHCEFSPCEFFPNALIPKAFFP